MDMGEFYPCIKVTDLAASIAFYQKLDFKIVEDHRDEGWMVMQHNNMALALYQGHIENNLINFRGGDVAAIANTLESRGLTLSKPAVEGPDGGWNAEIIDPDGNVIFFNTYPGEREAYLRDGKLIDY